MKRIHAVLAAAVCVLGVSVASAQNQNFEQAQQQQQQGQAAAQAMTSLSDMQIAAWLSVVNHGEVALGQLAENHAKSQQVKDLAREMVQKHTDFGQQLARFAGSLGNMQAGQQFGAQQQVAGQAAGQQATGQQPAAQHPANPQAGGQQNIQTLTSSTTNPPAFAGQVANAGGLNFIAAIQQIGTQCEQSLARELGEYQGAHFDKAYVGQQIGGHLDMIAKIRVLRQYASPQLQQVLAQGEQDAHHHLEQFKQLMKSLESDHS